MTVKQKKKRTMNIDAIIENAAKLSGKEAQAVVDYLESIKFAERKPPSSVVKTKLKSFVGGDEDKLKLLYKAPQENELKAREIKTEHISATQQYRAIKDMLKVSEDASISDVIKAFAEKAQCSEEVARSYIANLRDEKTSDKAYTTMMTMMSGGKKIGDSQAPGALDDSGLNIDEVIKPAGKILVEGKGDGDVSGRLSTGKMFRPNVASSAERETAVETPQDVPSEIEEIAPPGDERPTTVMPAPEIKDGKPVLQPLEKISLKTIDDMAQEAEPPGKTRQVKAPKLDAPEKLPKDVGGLPRPEDMSQPAEPPGVTQSVRAIKGEEAILEINRQADEIKEILLVKGSKLTHVKERMPGVSDSIIEEGVKRYAAELIQNHKMSKEQISKKLVHKGFEQLEADAALIVLDDEGIDRSSRISQIPVRPGDIVEDRAVGESKVDLKALPVIKKTDKREPTEELEAPDIEEMAAPKSEEKEGKAEEKKEEKVQPPPAPSKKKEEKEEKTDEEKSEEEKKDSKKIHTSDAFDPTRLSFTPSGLKAAMDKASEEAEKEGMKPHPEVSQRSNISDILMDEETEEKPEKEGSGVSTGESIEIEFDAPATPPKPPKRPPVLRKRPSAPSHSPSRPSSVPPAIGADFRGNALASANGHGRKRPGDERISLLSPEAQADEEITDVLVVPHAIPVSKLIEQDKKIKEMVNILMYKHELTDKTYILTAVYDGAKTYIIQNLENEKESNKGKKEDEIRRKLKAVGYKTKDIKKLFREPPVMKNRAKSRQVNDRPLSHKLDHKTIRKLKWTGIIAGITTGVAGLVAGTAAITYKLMMDNLAMQQKPEKEKQEQVEQKPAEEAEDETLGETVEIFMSEISIDRDASMIEQPKDVKAPVEDKTPAEQPAKPDEPLVETQPKPAETAEVPKEEPEVKVTNGGKTIEKPLKDEDVEPKKSATSDLEEIFGGM